MTDKRILHSVYGPDSKMQVWPPHWYSSFSTHEEKWQMVRVIVHVYHYSLISFPSMEKCIQCILVYMQSCVWGAE